MEGGEAALRNSIAAVALALLAGASQAHAEADSPMVINLNDSVDKSRVGSFVSNRGIPSGAGLILIGPDEHAREPEPVDHVRIVQYGFGIDPLYSCYFSNGDATDMKPVQNRETLCTFQARGCTEPDGCTLEGEGFGLSTVQLRISACEDWKPGSRCTRVLLSTTKKGTSTESTKTIWADGGHIEYGNFRPSAGSSCGKEARIEGTDNAFRLTVGADASPICTVAFDNPWRLAYSGADYRPICTINSEQGRYVSVSPASASIDIKGDFRAGDSLSVICVGRHDWPVH